MTLTALQHMLGVYKKDNCCHWSGLITDNFPNVPAILILGGSPSQSMFLVFHTHWYLYYILTYTMLQSGFWAWWSRESHRKLYLYQKHTFVFVSYLHVCICVTLTCVFVFVKWQCMDHGWTRESPGEPSTICKRQPSIKEAKMKIDIVNNNWITKKVKVWGDSLESESL